MAKVKVGSRYVGFAEQAVDWEAIERIFDAIWSPSWRSLPTFPSVIGGVHARWVDGAGLTYEADTLDEVAAAYERYETARISISGHGQDLPMTTLLYVPAQACVRLVVAADSPDVVHAIEAAVRHEFPLASPPSSSRAAAATGSPPLKVFCSYSHRDEKFLVAMNKHLSAIRRQDFIFEWHDREILPGKEWEEEIEKHLAEADVILLLISAEFLASDYCYSNEMMAAMRRHDAGEACVIPIILRPVDWRGAPFSKLQALPSNARPVANWRT